MKRIIAVTIICLALTCYGIVMAFCELEPSEETIAIINNAATSATASETSSGSGFTYVCDSGCDGLAEWRINEIIASERPYVPEETEKPFVPTYTYTDDDLYCLACVIYAEAGADYCSDELRMAVGNVVLNRVSSDLYPNSIRKVIEQPKQYGWLSRDGIFFPTNAEQHAIDRAYDCARRLLGGERPLPENVIYQAEFSQGSETYAMIDGVYFCR